MKSSVTWILWLSSYWLVNFTSSATELSNCDMSDAEVELVILEDTSNREKLVINSEAYPKFLKELPVKSLEVALSLVGDSVRVKGLLSVCFEDFLARTPNIKSMSDDFYNSTIGYIADLARATTNSYRADDFASAISHVIMSGQYFSTRPETIKILMMRSTLPPKVNTTGTLAPEDMAQFEYTIPYCTLLDRETEAFLYPGDDNMQEIFATSDVIPIVFNAAHELEWRQAFTRWGLRATLVHDINAWSRNVTGHSQMYLEGLGTEICTKIGSTQRYTKHPVPDPTRKPQSLSTQPSRDDSGGNDSSKKKVMSGIIGAASASLVLLGGALAYLGVQKWREKRQSEAVATMNIGNI